MSYQATATKKQRVRPFVVALDEVLVEATEVSFASDEVSVEATEVSFASDEVSVEATKVSFAKNKFQLRQLKFHLP